MKLFTFLSLLLLSCSTPDQAEDELVVGLDSRIRSIDPRYATDANSQYIESLIYCSLFEFDRQAQIRGQVVSRYHWIDEKSLSLELKAGFQFHNGEALTAAHIKDVFDNFLESNVYPRKFAFHNLQSIEIIDKRNIVFHLKKSEPSFLQNLVFGLFLEKEDQLIGCGHYQIDTKNSHELILSSNNPNLQFQKLKFKFVKDVRTRFSKLQRGEIDLIQNALNYDLVHILDQAENSLYISSSVGLNTAYIGLNFRDPFIASAKVRQALSLAISPQKIIDKMFYGHAIAATGLLLPTDPYHEESLESHVYDPSLAKKLLTGLDIPELVLAVPNDPFRVQVAKALAEQWQQVGVNVKVQSMDWGKFKNDVDHGVAQMWLLKWTGFKDPDILRYLFSSKSIPPDGANRGYYQNKELDQLLDLAASTLDSEERKKLYGKVQLILSDDLPYLFLWHEHNVAIKNNRLKDYQIYLDGRFDGLLEYRQ